MGQADIHLVVDSTLMKCLSSSGMNLPVLLDTTDPVADSRPKAPSPSCRELEDECQEPSECNDYSIGTFARNNTPTELGDAEGSKYVILGWIWNGKTWLESRSLTGA